MADFVLEGVDYAFGSHPSPAALVAAGKRFVVRYGGPGTEDKWIHADEARALAAAGIWIVANAEGSQSGLIRGFDAGASWARSADAWFRAIGMPEGRPIYFSVDFDTTTDDWSELEAAMDGAASVIGRDRVGVYGEYTIVAHLHGTGRAAWAWQAYAWSSGRWYGRNHIEQYHNGVIIDGVDCDLDRALQSDYGQWMPGISGGDMDLDQQQLTLPAETLATGELVPANGNDEHVDAATALAYALRNAYAARRAAEATLALVQKLATGDREAIRAIVREELDKSHLQG